MKIIHQSYSDVVNTLDLDKEKGKAYLVKCVRNYDLRKKEIDDLQNLLDRKLLERESIVDAINYTCKHLKIQVPFSILHNNDLYVIGKNYQTNIVKSDAVF